MLGIYRKKYIKIFMPVGKFFAMLNISPNTLTIASVFVSFAAFFAFGNKDIVLGLLFVFISLFFDMADGATARYTKKECRFGSVLDHVSDRYAEFLIISGIVLGEYVHWMIGFITLFGMLMASYARSKAESVGGLESCTVGIAERQEKFILIITGAIV